jgi:hypothetical protein
VDRVALADLAQEWAVVQDWPLAGVPCIPHERRRADQAVRDSVREWVRVQDLARGQALASVREWVALDSPHRLLVKRRVRRVQVREVAADRVTRKPKKAR